MAKGRRLTISRSERFLGGYGYGHSHESNDNDGLSTEFAEEDVWSDGGDGTDESSGEWHSLAAHESVGRRRIARGGGGGGLSFAFEDPSAASPRIVFRGNDGAAVPRVRHVATSAPVNVPDWGKIYRVNSVESMQEWSSEGVEEDGGEMGMIPPHEYVARSRSNKSGGASVFEGVGRTLKGRDLRRVRDAVWRQTGFDG